MAEKIIYEIEADSKDAIKGIDNVTGSLKGAEEQSKETNKEVGGLKEAGKKGSKGIAFIKNGIKGLGTAIKGAGIGLLLTVFGAIFEAVKRNQKVLDGFETVINVITVSVKSVTDALGSAYDQITKSTDGFDAMKKVIVGLMTIAITPLKLAFYQIKTAMQVANVAYQNVFGDSKSVLEAKKALEESSQALKQVALDAVDAGKSVVNNFGEAFDEAGNAIKTVTGELGKIEPSKILETASTMTKLGNEAAIAAVKQAGLIEEFDRLAEKQRQIRDDESLSIEVRKKANDELAIILEKQQKAMLAQADTQIASAKALHAQNNNQESALALLETENNRKGVLAQIEGFRSEQKVNAVALLKEEIELTNGLLESDTTLAFDKRKFAAEQITDLELRLATLKSINADEAVVEEERLTKKRDSFTKGTQAYVDAQDELNARKEEFKQIDISLSAEEKQRKIEERQVQIDDELVSFEQRRQLLTDRRNEILNDERLTEEERLLMLKANSEASITIAQKEAAAKSATLSAVGGALSAFSDLAGKETAAGKAMASASALINTYRGISDIWGAPGVGTPSMILASKIASSAVVGIQGFKAVKSINAVKVPGGGGGGLNPSMPTTSKPSSPTFNVVGQSPSTVGSNAQSANTQIENTNNNPTRAYVVSTDISSQQALDRDIEEDNSIG